jgi:rRNA maturation protein Nop10
MTIFCRQCGYALYGLDEGRCPECGTPFDISDPATFDKREAHRRRRIVLRRAKPLLLLLACLTAALAIAAGYLDWRWRAEQPAIAEIRQAGGSVHIARPALPSWITSALGKRFGYLVERADAVALYDRCDDSVIAQAALLPGLRDLRIQSPLITDAGLSHIKGLSNLRRLDLRTDRITNAGIAPLSSLSGLEELALYPCMSGDLSRRLNDSGLACIRGLTKLKKLTFDGSRITRAGMVNLEGMSELRELDGGRGADPDLESVGKLKNLRALNLFQSRLTREGFVRLSKLNQLESLNLGDADLSDDDLRDLQSLSNLRTLSLMRAPITDAGVIHLAAIPNLQKVDLRHTKITEGGVKTLQAAKPGLTISWSLK